MVSLQIMIERETVDKILETLRIEDVIGDFVALKRRGANYTACCPFHNEKTPSFAVSPAKGIYKCFGCGKAGNAVSFVMEHEQISYVEALKYLGKKYGIEIKETQESIEDTQERLNNESLLIVNDFAQKFFTKTLWEDEEGISVGLSYFKERGFTDQTINKFILGYSLNQRRALTHAAQRAGYKKEHLVSVGLTIERENGELLDRFYERVIFPIRSVSGKVIAFGGRKLRNDKEIAKYINSPESSIYVKNKVLYGIYEAKAAIAKEQKCYLVEGYTDVISFHQAGIENVVASSGTSLTTGQIQLIKRFSNKVTVLYDGDWAGIKASLRGIDMLLEEGLEIKVALFPNGEDPDSFAKSHNKEEIKNFLKENEEDFIDFKCKVLNKDAENDPLSRARVINDIINSIAVIPDTITRNVYAEQTATKLNIAEEVLQQQLNKIRKKKQIDNFLLRKREAQRTQQQTQIEEENIDTKLNLDESSLRTIESIDIPIELEQNIEGSNAYCKDSECELLYYLINFGQQPIHLEDDMVYGAQKIENQTVSQFIKNQLLTDELEFQNSIYKQIFNEYFTLDGKSDEYIQKYFTNHPNLLISKTVIDIITQPYTITIKKFSKSLVPEKNILGQVVPKAVLVYKAKITNQAVTNLTIELKDATNPQRIDEIMNQLGMLNQVRRVFSKELNRIII